MGETPTTQSQDDETCLCCGAVGPDTRFLLMGCFVDMMGITPTKDLPLTYVEAIIGDGLPPKSLYSMVICKACRGDWLEAVWQWWQAKEGERLRNVPLDRERLAALLQKRYDTARTSYRTGIFDMAEAGEVIARGSEVLTLARSLGIGLVTVPDFPAAVL